VRGIPFGPIATGTCDCTGPEAGSIASAATAARNSRASCGGAAGAAGATASAEIVVAAGNDGSYLVAIRDRILSRSAAGVALQRQEVLITKKSTNTARSYSDPYLACVLCRKTGMLPYI
jgi:hypothetical protein